MEFKKSIPYPILISPTPNNGFIVSVGCVKAAYSNSRKMVLDLEEYLDDPEKVEKQYNADLKNLDRVAVGNIPNIRGGPYNTASEPSVWSSGSILRAVAKQEDGEVNENTES